MLPSVLAAQLPKAPGFQVVVGSCAAHRPPRGTGALGYDPENPKCAATLPRSWAAAGAIMSSTATQPRISASVPAKLAPLAGALPGNSRACAVLYHANWTAWPHSCVGSEFKAPLRCVLTFIRTSTQIQGAFAAVAPIRRTTLPSGAISGPAGRSPDSINGLPGTAAVAFSKSSPEDHLQTVP